jgi:L-ascorbate metabolism protein UlaG (beta-lactamase superfamily)
MSARSVSFSRPSVRCLRLLLPAAAFLLLATACSLFPAATSPAYDTGPLTVTFLGNSTLLFDDGTDQLMIDGFLSRPGLLPVASGRLRTHPPTVDAALARAGATRIRALFVAHSHYDHALDAAYVIHRSKTKDNPSGAKLHGSESTLNIGRGGDLAEKQMALFQPRVPVKVGAFTVTVLRSRHSDPIPGINDDLGHTIGTPLRQPARVKDYAEGGTFDFLIRHRGRSILVKPSAHYLTGALDHVRADVLFLGVTGLGSKPAAFRDEFYQNTVRTVRAKRVIPIHWDNFLCPLSDRLALLDPRDQRGLDDLQHRLAADRLRYDLMQGYQTITIPR